MNHEAEDRSEKALVVADVLALQAEVARLRADYEREKRLHTEVILRSNERARKIRSLGAVVAARDDRIEELLNQLPTAVPTEPAGGKKR